jgi:long-subunit fatty acid transport protein
MDVEMEGQINLFAIAPAPVANIERRWRDTVSVRLGSSFHLGDWGEVSAGAFYETGATPPGYEHIDFMSFDRIGLSAGFSAQLGPVRLSVAYMHVFQEPRSVPEATAKGFQLRPLDACPDHCDFGAGWSGVPANSGVFESSYDILSGGLEVSF